MCISISMDFCDDYNLDGGGVLPFFFHSPSEPSNSFDFAFLRQLDMTVLVHSFISTGRAIGRPYQNHFEGFFGYILEKSNSSESQ